MATIVGIDRARYSFVIPLYNESDTVPELYSRLTAVVEQLDGDAEFLFVDDASRDGTAQIVAELHRTDARVKLLRLSRNFGHQLAISAGLDYAEGDAVVVMDGDLQDPPEVVPELVAKWREGYEIVHAVREAREGETWLKRATASGFYRVFRRLADTEMTVDVGDFRLVDRRPLDAFRAMRERGRYVRGMFSWIGYRQTMVPYRRAERYGGRPKYSYRRSLRLAVDAIVSFSDVPLRIALVLGFIVSIVSFVVGIAAIVAKEAGAFVVPGWASIVVAVSFLGGVQLIMLGMLGLYVARIFEEVKARPLYLVHETLGLAQTASDAELRLPTQPR